VRELSAEEEVKLQGALRDDYLPLFQFALLTGMRMNECLRLRWADIDWGNRIIRIRGKGEKIATIPLQPEVRDLLFPLQAHHEEAVFCYRVSRTRGNRTAGEWLPITQSGLKTRWRRDRKGAGIPDYRWHDNRHTAATRVLRGSKNLRAVQKLLRHSAIETTTKYAHVTDDDVRDALEAAAESQRLKLSSQNNVPQKKGLGS
jgi:integrase